MKINQFFNQINNLNENKRVDKNEMFSFISKHLDLIQDFQLQPLYERVLVDVIKKKTGYYLFDKSGYYELAEFPNEKIPRLMSFEETINTIKNIERKFNNSEISIQQRKVLKRLDHIFTQSTYEGNGIFKMFGYYSSYVNLIDLLLYIIKDELHNDLYKANEINNKYFNGKDIGKFTIKELNNIEIQTFKNGKVKIKNYKWDEKTKEIYDNYKKLKYNY